MSIKTITVHFKVINNEKFNRLDPKYFELKLLFDEISSTSSISVKTIAEMGIKVNSGKYIDSYIDSDEGIPYLRVGNIKPFCLNEDARNIVYVNKNVPKEILTEENDIIIGRTQATIHKLGVSSIIDYKNRGSAVSQHVSKIHISSEEISPFYLAAYFNSKLFKAQMALASYGDTRVELTHNQIKDIKIFIPEKKIENRIEHKVKLIIKLHRKAEKLILQAQRIIYENIGVIFPKEDNQKYFTVSLEVLNKGLWNPRYYLPKYLKTIEMIREENDTLILKDIIDIRKGNEVGSSNYLVDLEKDEDCVPFIRTSDLINFEVDQFPDYYVSNEIYEQLNQDIKTNDILYNKEGKIGFIAMVTPIDKFILQSHIQRVRLKKDTILQHIITQEYLFILLSIKEIGIYQAERNTVIQSTIPTISNRLLDFEIPILDISTIKEVTRLVQDAFSLKNQRKKLIKEVRKEIDSFVIF